MMTDSEKLQVVRWWSQGYPLELYVEGSRVRGEPIWNEVGFGHVKDLLVCLDKGGLIRWKPEIIDLPYHVDLFKHWSDYEN